MESEHKIQSYISNKNINNFLISIFMIIVSTFSLILFFTFRNNVSFFVDIDLGRFIFVLLSLFNILFLTIIFLTCYISFINSRNKSIYITMNFFVLSLLLQIAINSYAITYGVFFTYGNSFTEILSLVLNVVIMVGGLITINNDSDEEVSNFRIINILKFLILDIIFILIIYFANYRLQNYEFYTVLKVTLSIFAILGYFFILYTFNKKHINDSGYFIVFLMASIVMFIFSSVTFILFRDQYYIFVILRKFYKFLGFLFALITVLIRNINNGNIYIRRQEEQLSLYAKNLEKIIKKRTEKINNVNKEFIKELEYARSIQQSLLPNRRIHFKNGVNFASEYFPCERLSGDYYDIYKIDEDNIAMYILDVSGHGISAALMTMFCNNFVKSTERLIKRYRGLKPHKNLKHFYEEFNKMNFPDEMHMVIFFASYNVVKKELIYCTGGMNCVPILIKENGKYEYLDKSEGFPICKMIDFYEPEYKSYKINLEKGDKILFYTDGLTDIEKNKIFSHETLIEFLVKNSSKNAKELNELIIKNVYSYIESLEDDISYFIMEV